MQRHTHERQNALRTVLGRWLGAMGRPLEVVLQLVLRECRDPRALRVRNPPPTLAVELVEAKGLVHRLEANQHLRCIPRPLPNRQVKSSVGLARAQLDRGIRLDEPILVLVQVQPLAWHLWWLFVTLETRST